ncbi:FAD-dependent oxidoreductase [Streptomyces sp. NPDC059637]|uniref:FAD-dependent oxidoreductase n=1 Tax=Streptomyces sp. NPDC059637 TaxID=3347752 RepID=UPI00369C7779
MNRNASAAPRAAEEVESYDHEVDVVVLGFGCAGAAAAHEAAAAGAEVLLIERAGGPGGSSALSGGEIYLGGGTPVQRACGFDDTPAEMEAFLTAALGPHADQAKIRLYCEGSTEHYQWLVDRGVSFNASLWDAPTWMPLTEDGLMWLGENSWPFDRIAKPAPRGHRPGTSSFGGWLLMEKLSAAVVDAGVGVHTDTLATSLVVDAGGRVVGVAARRYGEELLYRARRGVVVTTGGFVDNEEMLAQHAPQLLGHDKVSDGLDDGSGITMAAAAGAATRRMSVVETALSVVPGLIARGMLVDALGQRFVNEDTYPGLISHAAVHRRPGPVWTIVDEEGYESLDERERWGVRPHHVAGTLAELEQETGMPAGSLQATVAAYNEAAERGEDPYFHKAARWLRPLRPPYAAIDSRIRFHADRPERAGSTTGVAGFTLGGLHTTVDGEVLDLAGQPIEGLYAAGRASSGMHGENYISGTSLGDGTFFGRRAGRAAAAVGR